MALKRAGWSIGDAAFVGASGERVWVVSGRNGENLIRAEGATQDEAWRLALERARVVGMLGHGAGEELLFTLSRGLPQPPVRPARGRGRGDVRPPKGESRGRTIGLPDDVNDRLWQLARQTRKNGSAAVATQNKAAKLDPVTRQSSDASRSVC
jgi:hypothetical protein